MFVRHWSIQNKSPTQTRRIRLCLENLIFQAKNLWLDIRLLVWLYMQIGSWGYEILRKLFPNGHWIGEQYTDYIFLDLIRFKAKNCLFTSCWPNSYKCFAIRGVSPSIINKCLVSFSCLKQAQIHFFAGMGRQAFNY